MHHSLRIYSRYRELFLRYYICQAKWTRFPLIGRLVRKVANLYGKKASGAYLLTLQEANEIVDSSDGLALGPCTCRTVFRNCRNPTNAEIMLSVGRNINGLIHTIIKCRQDFYAICNCCSCCCVPLRLNKQYGIGNALVRKSNVVEEVKERQFS